MSLFTVHGLEVLKRRFDAPGLEEALTDKLAQEAATIQGAAAYAAPGRLGDTIDIIDESDGARARFAIGTRHRAARFLEYGTRYMSARPFLLPTFLVRLPRLKHELTNTLQALFTKR